MMADENVATPTDAPSNIGELKRKAKLTGTVKRTELYGAFVDIGVGTDAIIHVSQMGGGKRVSEALKVGDQVDVWVDKVDADRGQIIVTMIEPLAVEWQDLAEGNAYKGTITRLENFGAFVNIGAEKEGLVHVSEISHDYLKHPSQAISVGDEVDVQVLSFSKRKRRINLSIKALLAEPAAKEVEEYIEDVLDWNDEEEEEEMPTAMEMALRQAMGKGAPSRGKRGKSKTPKRYRRRQRRQQNDIISRTLEMGE